MKYLQELKGVFFILILTFTIPVHAIFAQAEQLGVYEKLDTYLPDSLIFTDDNFNKIDLKTAMDKPTVLAMVYYECPGICTPLLNGLAEVVGRSELQLGKDYQVFTVSFNHLENSVLAAKKKKTYLKLAGKENNVNGWQFFTGDSLMIAKLLQSIGYYVKQEGKEFVHPATLVVLGKDGKINRYLHGTEFLPFDLKMAVVESAEGRSGPTINKVLQFCFSYDADGKKYVFNTTKISGSIIILAAISFFISLLVSGNRKKKTNNID